MKQHGLKLKLPKRQFVRDETNDLGFVIDKKCVNPGTDNVVDDKVNAEASISERGQRIYWSRGIL